jgi:hypothetical protein
MERALESLPRTLTDAYDGIIKRINSKKSGETEIALLAVLWIFNAARPLRIEELRELLVVHSGCKSVDEKYLLSTQSIIGPCESLILYDKASGQVAFIHFSAREYFLERYDAILPSISELANTCLTYLSFDVFERGPCEDEESLYERLNTYKASKYVAEYWGMHAKKAEGIAQVQQAVVVVLASESRRNSILQMEAYVTDAPIFIGGQTVLHVMVRSGLVKTCITVLDGNLHLNEFQGCRS